MVNRQRSQIERQILQRARAIDWPDSRAISRSKINRCGQCGRRGRSPSISAMSLSAVDTVDNTWTLWT